jgi:2-iminobutanoate/2-iminopropanoate deaminase
MKRIIHSDRAPKAIGPYNQAVEIDGWVFTAGQIGIDPETGELREGIEAQTEQVMKNLKAILEEAGLNFSDVVKTTIFLKKMEDFPKVNNIYAKFFNEPYPSRSTVEVSNLPKGALIEIELIAFKR